MLSTIVYVNYYWERWKNIIKYINKWKRCASFFFSRSLSRTIETKWIAAATTQQSECETSWGGRWWQEKGRLLLAPKCPLDGDTTVLKPTEISDIHSFIMNFSRQEYVSRKTIGCSFSAESICPKELEFLLEEYQPTKHEYFVWCFASPFLISFYPSWK